MACWSGSWSTGASVSFLFSFEGFRLGHKRSEGTEQGATGLLITTNNKSISSNNNRHHCEQTNSQDALTVADFHGPQFRAILLSSPTHRPRPFFCALLFNSFGRTPNLLLLLSGSGPHFLTFSLLTCYRPFFVDFI